MRSIEAVYLDADCGGREGYIRRLKPKRPGYGSILIYISDN